METVTLSSKGQIVIPVGIRKRMRLKTGNKLIIEEESEGIVLKPIVRLSEMLGRYKVPGGTKALKAMRARDEKDWIERISAIRE
jgi:AbrB family looped-hinge helix DNA binding protein